MMMISKRILVLLPVMISSLSCGPNHHPGSPEDSDSSTKEIFNPADRIPRERQSVKKEPVCEYQEKTDNHLNDWYFSVKLFETAKTFHYLMKMQFEELRATDTLKLPNFGTLPHPIIKKGKDRYSCIIGFMDDKNQFREYKLVHVESGNELKVTALHHYAVSTWQEP